MSSPRTLDSTRLLSCRNSVLRPTKCQAYCGMFTPEEGDVGAITALTKCVICGCYAASHLHPVQERDSAQNVENKPENISSDASTQPSGSFPETKKSQLPFSKDAKPFPSGSATASRIFGSRTDSKIPAENFSASPFRDHVTRRKERRDNAQAETDSTLASSEATSESRKRRFEPAEIERKERFEDITGRGRPKKKKKPQKTSTGPIPRATSSKSSKQVTFHIGLYGKTSDLAAGKAKRPTPAEFQFMQYSGRIRAVIINENASHDDICNAVELKFDELLPTTDIARFSLLQCVLNGGQGTLAALRPSPLTLFMVKDLEFACLFTRPKGIPAKAYPNFLYISLPAGSEDLDSLNPEGDVKTNGSSQKSKSKAKSKARQVNTESDEESGLSGKGDDEDDTAKQKTELEQDGTTSEPLSLWTVEFDCLVRILYNMTGDKGFEYPWWTPVTKHHEQYRSFASTAARLKLWLRRITKNDLDDFVFQHVVGIIRHDILTACEGLQALYASQSSWSSADHRQFLDLFSLGPGGLDLVVECLQILYDEFQVVDLGILTRLARDYTDVYEGVRRLPKMLLSLVHLFRAKNSRYLWDPKDGFSEFLIILGKYRGQLPVCVFRSL
ncbi:hypothetical protein F5877DRAFT_85347 [Lentinula edodes]|nr:hypothetical protein F5877DRAFT_85347 [Lentinula edodes]